MLAGTQKRRAIGDVGKGDGLWWKIFVTINIAVAIFCQNVFEIIAVVSKIRDRLQLAGVVSFKQCFIVLLPPFSMCSIAHSASQPASSLSCAK